LSEYIQIEVGIRFLAIYKTGFKYNMATKITFIRASVIF